MATIKSFTSLEQSKKLTEILPLESADMTCIGTEFIPYPYCESKFKGEDNVYPAWSLAALLNILPDSIYDNTNEFSQLEFTKKSIAYIQGTTDSIKIGVLKDNLIDACVAMILKLHELKLL